MSRILVKQHDITDCGAACLTSIAAHYKLQLPVARIRQFANTDKKGTNVLGLLTAANKIGFDCAGVKGDHDSLEKIPLPAIAHVVINTLQHYVVIYKVKGNFVHIMDPSDGKIHKKPKSEFLIQWSNVLILLSPKPEFKTGNESVSKFSRFWQLIKPHKSLLLQAVIGATIYTILGLSTAIYVQKITDHVLVTGNIALLRSMSLAMIAILLTRIFIAIQKSLFTIRTGQQIDAQLILGYYEHLLKLPQQFFDSMRIGEIMSRINDAVKIRTFINDVSINLVVSILVVFFSFALMFTYYWKLALLTLTIIPFYVLIYFVVNKLNHKIQRKLMEQSADLESQLIESLRSIQTIKRFNLTDFIHQKTENLFIKLLKSLYKSGLNGLFTANAVELISQLLVIVILWTGAGFVVDQQLTAGELFSFYTLTGYFMSPASSLISANKILQDALIAADRLFEILDLEVEKNTNRVPVTTEMLGDIRFEKVKFKYGSRTLVFDELDLFIKKGSFTAIIGESGSGKSTLMALMQNMYALTAGSISIGNYDLNYLDTNELRKLLVVVPQQTDLFTGNIINNIAIGDENPDLHLILNICTQLGILEFIEQLPNGFETELGENGATLSGGQKQRIAIARALYRKPEILMLDEATSSLDLTAEKYVQQAIEILRQQGKTVIVIAHRLSTVRNADHIIMLQKGIVVEEGSHEHLMGKNSHYFRLWQQQFDHPLLT